MKKILLALLLSACVISDAHSVSCIEVSELAETVMSARQRNVDITKFMANFDSDSTLDEMIRTLAKKAYALPLYSTDEYRINTIRTFKNDVYLSCAE